jgi:hypothetical protein
VTAQENTHEHAWEPWPGECGVYRCACGASGYRQAGEVRAHRKTWEPREAPSVRQVGDEEIQGGARVAPKKGAE